MGYHGDENRIALKIYIYIHVRFIITIYPNWQDELAKIDSKLSVALSNSFKANKKDEVVTPLMSLLLSFMSTLKIRSTLLYGRSGWAIQS